MFTGHKGIDQILHTIIDYVLRDYVASWFSLVSDSTEFSELRVRHSIEESVHAAYARIKSTPWVPLITTSLADDVATHTRIYRLATQATLAQPPSPLSQQQQQQHHNSPLRRPTLTTTNTGAALRHRRNKSDTDLSAQLSAAATAAASTAAPRNVANSKFYTDTTASDESQQHALRFGTDADSRLVAAFFEISDTWRDECMDDARLDGFLHAAAETILYFTIPEEDFACRPLRHFLSALLASVVCRPLLDLLAEPDFLNLQLAKLVPADAINSEFFIKLVRQCNDLDELRACRQFVVREMDAKFREPSAAAELNSLKYTQKLIDLRLSFLQNRKAAGGGATPAAMAAAAAADRATAAADGCGRATGMGADIPQLTLEELLTKELALSYYLDYLSILNLQKYVIFYLTASGEFWCPVTCFERIFTI